MSTVYIVATETCQIEDVKLFSDIDTAMNFIRLQAEPEEYFVCHYKLDENRKEYSLADLTCPVFEEVDVVDSE